MNDPFYTAQSLLVYTDSPGDTPGYYSDATNKVYTEDMIDTPLDPGPNTLIEPVAGEVPNQAIVKETSNKKTVVGLSLGWLALAAVGFGIVFSNKTKNRS